jgi:hypothetical protein
MLTAIWIRFQPWVAAVGAALGVIAAAFVAGRRSGGDRVRAQAAAAEQKLRENGDEAARDAERTGAVDRLRDGRF